MYSRKASVLLLNIGTGFVRSNLIVLLGRLFRKEDQKRDLAFILRYIAINFSSFLGALAIGYTGEAMGYTYGFSLAALAIFSYLTLFLIIRNKLDIQEKALPFSPLPDPLILDQEQDIKPQRNPFYTVLIISFLLFIFSKISGTALSFFSDAFNQITRFLFLEQESSIWLAGIFNFISSIIMGFALLFIWRKKSSLSSWQRITVAFFGVLLVSLILIGVDYLPEVPLQIGIIGAGILIAGVEVAMSAVSLSYITRLSEPKYASTTIGVFFLLSYLWTEGVSYLENSFSVEISLIHCFCLALIIGLAMLLFRKKWPTLSGGLR
ncbi:MFS transporter [Lewinella cohaerens]|uniref:MFS transporter n=1 Tax=Lewinella cohaerens TaxID=70995 RepID=UPI0003702897|nr:MFS transporter [Lewinella cohaerens]